MNVKKSLVLLILGIGAMVASPIVALADEQATGEARMHDVATPPSGITGIVTFQDDGNHLYISGTATGLDEDENYLSLIYDKGSVASGVPVAFNDYNPLADPQAPCEPTILDGGDDDISATMFIGFWTNNGDGTGNLNVVDIGGVRVPLEKFRTVSIRLSGLSRDEPSLQACGVVVPHED